MLLELHDTVEREDLQYYRHTLETLVQKKNLVDVRLITKLRFYRISARFQLDPFIFLQKVKKETGLSSQLQNFQNVCKLKLISGQSDNVKDI